MSHFTWESANNDTSYHNSNYFSTTIIDNRHDNITTTERASPIDRPNNTNTFPVKCLQTIQNYSPLQNHYQQFLFSLPLSATVTTTAPLNYKIAFHYKTTTNSFLITRVLYITRQPPTVSILTSLSATVTTTAPLNYKIAFHCKTTTNSFLITRLLSITRQLPTVS